MYGADRPSSGENSRVTDQQIATAIKTAMAANAAAGSVGVVSVTIDGITTQFSWPQAQQQLEWWERRAARASGKRRLFSSMDLRGL